MNADDPRDPASRQRPLHTTEGRTTDPRADAARADRSPEEIEAEIARERARMGDTLEAIQHRLSPGQLLDQALEYSRRGPGEYLSHLGVSVKENPMPVALVAIGLGWLMTSGAGTHMTGGAAHGAAGSSSGHTRGEGSRAGSAVSDAMHRIGDAARSARDSASHAAASARDMAAHAGESSSAAGERIREQGRHARDSARHYAERASSGWSHMVRDQPLVLGAIGLAIGAALGAGLPPTRREDELLGEYRDDLVDRAAETGKEQLERGKRVAAAAAGAASSEVDRQGQSTEAGRMEAVAKAASAAAKGEAERQGMIRPDSGAAATKSGSGGSAQATSTSATSTRSGSAGGSPASASEVWSPSAPHAGTTGQNAPASGTATTPTSTKPPGSK